MMTVKRGANRWTRPKPKHHEKKYEKKREKHEKLKRSWKMKSERVVLQKKRTALWWCLTPPEPMFHYTIRPHNPGKRKQFAFIVCRTLMYFVAPWSLNWCSQISFFLMIRLMWGSSNHRFCAFWCWFLRTGHTNKFFESGSSPRVKSLPRRCCLQNMGEELVRIL